MRRRNRIPHLQVRQALRKVAAISLTVLLQKKDVCAMFFDDVVVRIVVDSMSKKDCAQVHWIRFKTQRRHILEGLTI